MKSPELQELEAAAERGELFWDTLAYMQSGARFCTCEVCKSGECLAKGPHRRVIFVDKRDLSGPDVAENLHLICSKCDRARRRKAARAVRENLAPLLPPKFAFVGDWIPNPRDWGGSCRRCGQEFRNYSAWRHHRLYRCERVKARSPRGAA